MKAPENIIANVVALKNGEKDAFSQIYRESYGYLHTCVIHIVKNEDAAQDMLQEAYSFLNAAKGNTGIPLADYDEAYLKEMDERTMEYRKTIVGEEDTVPAETEEAEADDHAVTEAKASAGTTEEAAVETATDQQSGVISGSIDVDPLIDRYANASKISEINEIVASGTKIYSSSGKTMIVYYNGESGDFLGYDFVPQTSINVGKHEVSADSDQVEAAIRNTGKWRMNVYPCTDGDGDLYVDFYAVP